MGSFFNEALWQQLAATFFGVVAAVPTGLWLNRLAQRHEARERQVQTEERQTQLLHALHDTLTINQRYLQAFIDESEDVLVDGVDLTVLDATASLKYEILNDIKLARDIDNLRANLLEIGQGIKLLVQSQYDALSHGDARYSALVQHMRDGITPKAIQFLEMSGNVLERMGVQGEMHTVVAQPAQPPQGVSNNEAKTVSLRH